MALLLWLCTGGHFSAGSQAQKHSGRGAHLCLLTLSPKGPRRAPDSNPSPEDPFF